MNFTWMIETVARHFELEKGIARIDDEILNFYLGFEWAKNRKSLSGVERAHNYLIAMISNINMTIGEETQNQFTEMKTESAFGKAGEESINEFGGRQPEPDPREAFLALLNDLPLEENPRFLVEELKMMAEQLDEPLKYKDLSGVTNQILESGRLAFPFKEFLDIFVDSMEPSEKDKLLILIFSTIGVSPLFREYGGVAEVFESTKAKTKCILYSLNLVAKHYEGNLDEYLGTFLENLYWLLFNHKSAQEYQPKQLFEIIEIFVKGLDAPSVSREANQVLSYLLKSRGDAEFMREAERVLVNKPANYKRLCEWKDEMASGRPVNRQQVGFPVESTKHIDPEASDYFENRLKDLEVNAKTLAEKFKFADQEEDYYDQHHQTGYQQANTFGYDNKGPESLNEDQQLVEKYNLHDIKNGAQLRNNFFGKEVDPENYYSSSQPRAKSPNQSSPNYQNDYREGTSHSVSNQDHHFKHPKVIVDKILDIPTSKGTIQPNPGSAVPSYNPSIRIEDHAAMGVNPHLHKSPGQAKDFLASIEHKYINSPDGAFTAIHQSTIRPARDVKDSIGSEYKDELKELVGFDDLNKRFKEATANIVGYQSGGNTNSNKQTGAGGRNYGDSHYGHDKEASPPGYSAKDHQKSVDMSKSIEDHGFKIKYEREKQAHNETLTSLRDINELYQNSREAQVQQALIIDTLKQSNQAYQNEIEELKTKLKDLEMKSASSKATSAQSSADDSLDRVFLFYKNAKSAQERESTLRKMLESMVETPSTPAKVLAFLQSCESLQDRPFLVDLRDLLQDFKSVKGLHRSNYEGLLRFAVKLHTVNSSETLNTIVNILIVTQQVDVTIDALISILKDELPSIESKYPKGKN